MNVQAELLHYPEVGIGVGGGGRGIGVDKMLKFYVKIFMWWARGCQASYPVHGQVLLTSGHVCPYQLDESIPSFWGFWRMSSILLHFP